MSSSIQMSLMEVLETEQGKSDVLLVYIPLLIQFLWPHCMFTALTRRLTWFWATIYISALKLDRLIQITKFTKY